MTEYNDKIVSLKDHKAKKEGRNDTGIDRLLGCPACYEETGEPSGEWLVVKYEGEKAWRLCCAECSMSFDVEIPVPDTTIMP